MFERAARRSVPMRVAVGMPDSCSDYLRPFPWTLSRSDASAR